MINKKGFTLVEISIIVIIISILLSFFISITVNKERYSIKLLSTELQKYDTAIKNFQIKYIWCRSRYILCGTYTRFISLP